MTLIRGFKAGPAVSFSGSPTVSPTTAGLVCVPSPCRHRGPSSTSFLALSRPPPALAMKTASNLAGEDHARQEAAQGLGSQQEADNDGDQDDKDTDRQKLALGRLGGDGDVLAL